MTALMSLLGPFEGDAGSVDVRFDLPCFLLLPGLAMVAAG
jgi:hypothetical protein